MPLADGRVTHDEYRLHQARSGVQPHLSPFVCQGWAPELLPIRPLIVLAGLSLGAQPLPPGRTATGETINLNTCFPQLAQSGRTLIGAAPPRLGQPRCHPRHPVGVTP
jgi:hypothetical protein